MRTRNDEPTWIDPDSEPDLEQAEDWSCTVGTATPLQEYSKPRKSKRRRRPIGFLRDDWPDIIE